MFGFKSKWALPANSLCISYFFCFLGFHTLTIHSRETDFQIGRSMLLKMVRRKPEYVEETHKGAGKTCKLHTKRCRDQTLDSDSKIFLELHFPAVSADYKHGRWGQHYPACFSFPALKFQITDCLHLRLTYLALIKLPEFTHSVPNIPCVAESGGFSTGSDI